MVSILCLVQVGNGIELEAVGLQFKPYWWLPCGVTWGSSQTVVVIKLQRTSAAPPYDQTIIYINLKINSWYKAYFGDTIHYITY